MLGKNNSKAKHIAWNGLQLHVPGIWEARIAGDRHLVFENDFQPQLQLRWEEFGKLSAVQCRKRINQLASQLGHVTGADQPPEELLQLKDLFDVATFFQREDGSMAGVFIACPDRRMLVVFQFLGNDHTLLPEAVKVLTTITCSTENDNLWRIQDFSLTVPETFHLKDYTFGAGLTRLSFFGSDCLLQTCTLGPADLRLKSQSLHEMLLTLTDVADLNIITSKDNSCCEGERNPSISGQILFRLRREKPFIHAKIWHVTKYNRLLAVMLSSNRPIPETTCQKICEQYEILQ